jgi:hypothetical protein
MRRALAAGFALALSAQSALAASPPPAPSSGQGVAYLTPGKAQPGVVEWAPLAQPPTTVGLPANNLNTIAGWTSVPLQMYPNKGAMQKCVLAFHSSGAFQNPPDGGVTSVDFYADGGAALRVTSQTTDNDTNFGENPEPAWCVTINLADPAWKPGLHEIRAIAHTHSGNDRILQNARYLDNANPYTQATIGVFKSIAHGYQNKQNITVVSKTAGSTPCLTVGAHYSVVPTGPDYGSYFKIYSGSNGAGAPIDTTGCDDRDIVIRADGAMPYGGLRGLQPGITVGQSMWFLINDGTIPTKTAVVDGTAPSDTATCGASSDPCKTISGALNSTYLTPTGPAGVSKQTGLANTGEAFAVSSTGEQGTAVLSTANRRTDGGLVNGAALVPFESVDGLTAGVAYWVVRRKGTPGAEGSSFQLALRPGGSPISASATLDVTLNIDVGGDTICLTGGNSPATARNYSYGPGAPSGSERNYHYTVTTYLTITTCPGSLKEYTTINQSAQNGINTAFVRIKNLSICGNVTPNGYCADPAKPLLAQFNLHFPSSPTPYSGLWLDGTSQVGPGATVTAGILSQYATNATFDQNLVSPVDALASNVTSTNTGGGFYGNNPPGVAIHTTGVNLGLWSAEINTLQVTSAGAPAGQPTIPVDSIPPLIETATANWATTHGGAPYYWSKYQIGGLYPGWGVQKANSTKNSCQSGLMACIMSCVDSTGQAPNCAKGAQSSITLESNLSAALAPNSTLLIGSGLHADYVHAGAGTGGITTNVVWYGNKVSGDSALEGYFLETGGAGMNADYAIVNNNMTTQQGPSLNIQYYANNVFVYGDSLTAVHQYFNDVSFNPYRASITNVVFSGTSCGSGGPGRYGIVRNTPTEGRKCR